MKAVLVLDSTPREKGNYSHHGAGIAICSPCCGNTFYAERPIAEREPLTAGPFECPACRKPFCVTHGEIVIAETESARPKLAKAVQQKDQ